jgi:hypothetical protein
MYRDTSRDKERGGRGWEGREREGERERDRQPETETETQRDRAPLPSRQPQTKGKEKEKESAETGSVRGLYLACFTGDEQLVAVDVGAVA